MTILWKILYAVGYISLIGPPRALIIFQHANERDGELAGKPLWFIVLAEWLVRAGLFLLLATSIESAVGDYNFERMNSDIFLGSLIGAGLVHTLAYYVCFNGSLSLKRAEKMYRFFRNFCYALIPAFIIAGAATLVQILHPQMLNSSEVRDIFFASLAFAEVVGIVEASLVKRAPKGLGNEFRNAAEQLDKAS